MNDYWNFRFVNETNHNWYIGEKSDNKECNTNVRSENLSEYIYFEGGPIILFGSFALFDNTSVHATVAKYK